MRYSLRYLLGWLTVGTVACWYVLVATPRPRDAAAWWLTTSSVSMAIALLAIGGKQGTPFPLQGTVLGPWIVFVTTAVLVVCEHANNGSSGITAEQWPLAAITFLAVALHAAAVGGGIELVKKGHDEGGLLIFLAFVSVFVLFSFCVPAVR